MPASTVLEIYQSKSKGYFSINDFMCEMRETREIQRNNYQDGQCRQSFVGKILQSMIAHTHSQKIVQREVTLRY